MFDDFTLEHIETPEATIRVRHGGSGPPLLLLHGYPQTHVMWHRIAPRLAREYSVVAMDLRGYGESSKPPTTDDHEPYSKRAMARDAVAVMKHLGHERFAVAGHDRGGRVAYRLALDHPERVRKIATLDIIPTGEHFRRADMKFGLGYWHWFFLAQPYPLPEKLIGTDPAWFLTGRPNRTNVHAPEALDDYMRSYRDPATIHASCEDYRAGATYDFQLDEADRGKKKIAAPLLALWAGRGEVGKWYDVLGIWRDWADDVRGHAIDAGHFMAEEAPDETYAALRGFFAE
ncbi:MAG: alpha/beta hydrolase [Candidatus Eremiobacteraeota bacterium]|nr:alpha/beta hydrolase [Candidatus Eremiobacteraeota bacterium]